jgi:signal transduction histidine kinase
MAKPLRALVVEDQDDDFHLLIRELARGGFDVRPRRVDTEAALNEALDGGEWDVVFADYTMPHFRGTLALEMVRQRGLDLPFIFVSGTIGEDVAVDAMRGGANDYVIKGNLKRLVPAVERELRDAQVRRERKGLEAQVHQAQKLETVGQLAGGVAHDFNNLLTVVLGNAELALLNPGLNAGQKVELQEIVGAAERARDLTRRLLAFSRRQVLDPQLFDVNAVVTGMESMFRRVLGGDIEVHTELADDAGVVKADAGQLEQVLLNLVVNARDAMPDGGSLRIGTAPVELTRPSPITTGILEPGQYAELTVTDRGQGMAPEILAHIFEPFFTTKPVGEGTGLGLATVYGIVTQSGGGVAVESAVGQGTTFRVYLPRADQPATASTAEPDLEPLPGGSETILLVEDEPPVRAFVARVLRRSGYDVFEAGRPEEAVRWLKDAGTPIHLLITDAVLPGKNGRELSDEAVRLRPDIRVLMMSGHAGATLTRRGITPGGDSLLEKPFSAAALARRVRAVLDGTAA